MIRNVKTLAVLLSVVALVALTGCASEGSPLEGTSWRLSGWSVSSLDPADLTITARFADGQISGNSGVNSYGGPYEAGPGDTLSVGEIASTTMAGPEPAMRAETAYMTLLGQARSFKVADGRLTLYDEGGNESLLFNPVSE
jgi:heat shock protein HslJ